MVDKIDGTDIKNTEDDDDDEPDALTAVDEVWMLRWSAGRVAA